LRLRRLLLAVRLNIIGKCLRPSEVGHMFITLRHRGISYADLKTNVPICESYVAAMRAMGHRTVLDDSGQRNALAGGSTDMGVYHLPKLYSTLLIQVIGNISYAVPGFHGLFTIPVEGVNHTPQFTNGAGSAESYKRALACAAGLAVVACQVLVDDKFAEDVKKHFDQN
jgi:hypothetical protein